MTGRSVAHERPPVVPARKSSGVTKESESPWTDALSATLVMITVWLLLLCSQWAQPYVGAEGAIFVAFLASVLIVWFTRARKDPVVKLIATPFGALIGFQSLAFWLYLLFHLAQALGLGGPGERHPPGAGPLMAVSAIVLAPLFEELLYRERLLLALKRVLGTPLSIVISSVCFALPHLQSWSLLGTFLVGLFLSVVMLWSRSIALCIAIHAGLNLAAILCGLPPTRWYMNCQLSGVLMVVLVVMASAWERKGRLAEGKS